MSGKDNSVADCLSWPVVGAVHLDLDYASVAVDQAMDADIEAYRIGPTGLQLEDVVVDGSKTTMVCDVSTKHLRPMVPTNLRWGMYDALRGLSHLGVKDSTRLVGGRLIWSGLRRNVKMWAGSCVACQRAKV